MIDHLHIVDVNIFKNRISTTRKNSFIRNSITSILATVILNPRQQPLYNVLAEFVKAVVQRVPEDGTLIVALAVRGANDYSKE